MLDLVQLTLQAGHGGDGRISFLRNRHQPKGGPDGGHGGDGGSVKIIADSQLTTLSHFQGKNIFIAESGQMGGKQQRTGSQGADLILKVPVGTVVWLLAENADADSRAGQARLEPQKFHIAYEKDPRPVREVDPPPTALEGEWTTVPKKQLYEFIEPGQELVLCQGGRGGRGNMAFKGSSNTTPLDAEFGGLGEAKVVALELKLWADIGFVGLPNAGKSTLLSVLTAARPKIAAYPFTTLEPQLGLMKMSDQPGAPEAMIADVPGLIAGASQGKGLGQEFLRHLEHCRALGVVLSLPDEVAVDADISLAAKAEQIATQLQQLEKELHDYGSVLNQKQRVLIVNKIDMYSDEIINAIKSALSNERYDLLFVSAVTGAGIAELKQKLIALKLKEK